MFSAEHLSTITTLSMEKTVANLSKHCFLKWLHDVFGRKRGGNSGGLFVFHITFPVLMNNLDLKGNSGGALFSRIYLAIDK